MPSMGGGAADGLQQVLARLFAAATLKQRQQEHADQQRQHSRGLDLQEQGLAATDALRQATLAETQRSRGEAEQDRDETRKVQALTQLRGNLQMMPKDTPIDSPDMLVQMSKAGLGGMLKPVPNEPRFTFGGTQQAENATAGLSAREAALTERERANLERERNNRERTGWGPPPIVIHTTDAGGNAVTKVEPRGDATGQTYEAAPTAETRNRQQAAKRASGVLEAVAELSERINVNQGAMATLKGAAEIQKAKINLSDDVSEYDGVVQGFTPMLARAVGHVGVLTEQDVQSVRAALPKPTDSKSVRDRKVKRFISLMEGGLPTGQTIGQALRDDGPGPTGGAPRNTDPLGIRR